MKPLFENWRKYLNESSYRQHQGGWYGTGDDTDSGAPEESGKAGYQLVSDLNAKLEEGGDRTNWVVDEVNDEAAAAGTYSMADLRDKLNTILDNNLGTSLEEYGL